MPATKKKYRSWQDVKLGHLTSHLPVCETFFYPFRTAVNAFNLTAYSLKISLVIFLFHDTDCDTKCVKNSRLVNNLENRQVEPDHFVSADLFDSPLICDFIRMRSHEMTCQAPQIPHLLLQRPQATLHPSVKCPRIVVQENQMRINFKLIIFFDFTLEQLCA